MYPVIVTGTHGSEKRGNVNVQQNRKASPEVLVTCHMPKVMCVQCVCPVRKLKAVCCQTVSMFCFCRWMFYWLDVYFCWLIPACNLLCFFFFSCDCFLFGTGLCCFKAPPHVELCNFQWPLSCIKLKIACFLVHISEWSMSHACHFIFRISTFLVNWICSYEALLLTWLICKVSESWVV